MVLQSLSHCSCPVMSTLVSSFAHSPCFLRWSGRAVQFFEFPRVPPKLFSWGLWRHTACSPFPACSAISQHHLLRAPLWLSATCRAGPFPSSGIPARLSHPAVSRFRPGPPVSLQRPCSLCSAHTTPLRKTSLLLPAFLPAHQNPRGCPPFV